MQIMLSRWRDRPRGGARGLPDVPPSRNRSAFRRPESNAGFPRRAVENPIRLARAEDRTPDSCRRNNRPVASRIASRYRCSPGTTFVRKRRRKIVSSRSKARRSTNSSKTQSFIVRDREHRSERRFDPLGKQAAPFLRRGRRIAENPRESFAKSARRFESAAVLRFIHAAALAHFAQRQSHPPGAMISLKRHSIMALELSARGRGIDRQRGQLLVGQPSARRALDFRAQSFDQFRRTLVRIHRPAAQTWPITAMQRFTRRREKKSTFSRAGFFAEQVGRQKIPVVRTPTKKIPSKLESRLTKARYIVSEGGRSSMRFICVRSASCSSRGSRCGRAQKQFPAFAGTFQSTASGSLPFATSAAMMSCLNCRRGGRGLFEILPEIRPSPRSARTVPRGQRSARFPNKDDPAGWPRRETGSSRSPGLRPAQAMPAWITIGRISGDDSMVRRAGFARPSGCLGDLRVRMERFESSKFS